MINHNFDESTSYLCADINNVNIAFLTTTTSRKNKYAADIYFMFKSRFFSKINLTNNV